MAENYTTYSIFPDPLVYTTVIANKVSWDDLPFNVDEYVYDDKGVDHFDGNYEHLVTIETTSVSAQSTWGIPWVLANLVDDYKGIQDAGGDLHLVMAGDYLGAENMWFREMVAGTIYGDSWNGFEYGTTYYLKIKRDEGVGTYGTLYCYVYSDSDRTNLLDTMSFELHEKEDFRYIYAVMSHHGASPRNSDGFSQDLDLQEVQIVTPSSIISAEAFGTPTLSPGKVIIAPFAIFSIEAFGTPIVSAGLILYPSSIPSAEVFGTPALVYDQIISPSSIASQEAFGSLSVVPGVVIISPSAISSLEAFGFPSLTLFILPSGISSSESFGSPTILPGLVTISPSAIASAEAFGIPLIAPVQVLIPTGIPSSEVFGSPTIFPGLVIIVPSSISSQESFGTLTLVPGIVFISPSAIASGEAFGTPEVSMPSFSEWVDWGVYAYAVAVCSYGSAVFAFGIAVTDGHLYRCESSDNAENWGSWIDMGDVSGSSSTRLACCFKDSNEAIVLYSIGGTLYRRRWNGETWESAAAWSNSLSNIFGIAVTYMGDWNVVVTGYTSEPIYGVWTCVLGDGYSAAVDSWSALKEVMIAESGSGISFWYPSLSMPDVFRMFFVEMYSGSESYSRPYWSHSLATADFISNLWREPIPFNLDSDKGLSLCYKSPYVWLTRPDSVWRASLSPASVEITDDLLAISSRIVPFSGCVELTLRNDDGRYNSLGSSNYEAIKKGSEILISWGYHTTAGKETGGFDPTTWIESWEYVTRDGHSEFILHSVDGWDLLDRWRARRQFTWPSGTKNIYQLLALIFARAGLELSAFSTSTAIVNQYPAFTINPGESGLTAVKRLLAMVPDVIFFVRDTAYLKNPQASDSSQYAYGTDHAILDASYRELAQKVNRAQVFGVGVFTEDWDWNEIALVYDRLVQASDININSITKAHQRGEAILRDSDIEDLNGHILVPMNCGQDLFDVIAITSPQTGLNASKRRVLSLARTWGHQISLNHDIPYL